MRETAFRLTRNPPENGTSGATLVAAVLLLALLVSGCVDRPDDLPVETDPPPEPSPEIVRQRIENDTLHLEGPAGSWAVLIYKVPDREHGWQMHWSFKSGVLDDVIANSFLIPPQPVKIWDTEEPYLPFNPTMYSRDEVPAGGVAWGRPDGGTDHFIGVVTSSDEWKIRLRLNVGEGWDVPLYPAEILSGENATFWLDEHTVPHDFLIEAEIPTPGWTHIQFVEPNTIGASESDTEPLYTSFQVDFSDGASRSGEVAKVPTLGSNHDYVGHLANEGGTTRAEYMRMLPSLNLTLGMVHIPVPYANISHIVEGTTYCGLNCGNVPEGPAPAYHTAESARPAATRD